MTVAATDRRQAVLYAGGRSRRNGFARVEFRFRGGRPGYDVRYVTRPVVQDGSGREVRVTGARILRVLIENAIDVPAPEGLTPPGPRRFPLRMPGRIGPVTDMVRLGGFEGIVTWAIGVSGRAPFRVRTAQNPQRLLIDIAGWCAGRRDYAEAMSYSAADARREMLEVIAAAIDHIAVALAAIGGAYELLDETTGDALEQRLFRPAQLALGRAQRTYNGFAERSGLPPRSFSQPSSGLPSQGVTGFLEAAGDAAQEADETLSSLQDSLRPVEVGDAELRAGLAEVRTLLARLPGETRSLLRTLGR